MNNSYNPNQPRDPSGTSTGGRWTGSAAAVAAARKAAGLRADEMGNTLIGKLMAGGFSESLGGKEPQTGYMTATTATTERVYKINEVNDDSISMFAVDNHDALSEPETYLGGWLDTDKTTKVTSAYLDVSTNFQSMAETVRAARNANQIGIYDVINKRTIFVNESRLYYEVGDGDPKKKVYID